MPGNRTPLRVHVLRSLERKMNAPFTVPTRTSVSELFLALFLETFFWPMKARSTTTPRRRVARGATALVSCAPAPKAVSAHVPPVQRRPLALTPGTVLDDADTGHV